MPEKKKASRNWKDPKIVIAALSLSGLLTLWNTFAPLDRKEDDGLNSSLPTPSVTIAPTVDPVCLTPTLTKNIEECVTVTKTRSS